MLQAHGHLLKTKECFSSSREKHLCFPPYAASPHDSAKFGGEVGNISLQSASGRTGREMPRGVPAEGGTERAEHEANVDYMELVRWSVQMTMYAKGSMEHWLLERQPACDIYGALEGMEQPC